MTLLELLVQELPKRGGWPETANKLKFSTTRRIVDDVDNEYFHFPNLDRLVLSERVKFVTREQYESALAAQKPSWDGVGLPPVGAKVEWMSEKYGWLGGTIAAYDEKYPSIAIIRHNDGYIGCNRGEIRTEADKKRDAAIIEIAEAMVAPRPKGDGGIFSKAVSVYNKIAAGKVPGIRLED